MTAARSSSAARSQRETGRVAGAHAVVAAPWAALESPDTGDGDA